ncbi:MAG: DVUA0089 family protein [Armatimonadota bacterium]|nr:DVUA0089 family protein [Armatimonadota bacterium]
MWTSAVNACAAPGRGRVASWTGTTAAGNYQIVLQGAFTAPLGPDPADCPPFEGWDEIANGGSDAGDLPSNAQIVALSGQTPCQSPVTRIRGDNAANDVDMYVIYIQDPANFVASTIGTPTAWDTQLWLFRCDGRGVVFNDDNPDGTGTLSRIDNRSNCITEPGVYLLAISRYNRDAVDANGQLLWNNLPFNAVRCPDGPGAANPVAGWTGTTSAGGRYIITLQGAFFVTEQGCAGTCPGQCPGDANNDGRVNNADLLVVLFNFGQSGSGIPGDVNSDGTVNNADLLVVLFNFGCGS